LDLISLIPLSIVILSLFLIRRFTIEERENGQGFTTDEAGEISIENDILNRWKFVKQIAELIKKTSSNRGSFPIGVVAPWGAGKTTFLNTLLPHFKGTDFIIIELNVWKCSNSGQIIEAFFKLLKERVEIYNYDIGSKLEKYASNLLKFTKEEKLDAFREFFFPTPDIETQYEQIHYDLKKINKNNCIYR
jgi:hypothetical protein